MHAQPKQKLLSKAKSSYSKSSSLFYFLGIQCKLFLVDAGIILI